MAALALVGLNLRYNNSMRKRLVLIITILSGLPFLVLLSPLTATTFPTIQDKMGLIQFFFSVYGFFIGLIAVWEYVVRQSRYIEPTFFLNKRSRMLAIKAGSFPCKAELGFFVANDGNVSIEKHAMNYTIILPKALQVHPKDGVQNEAGKAVIPNHRDYERDGSYQVLGGEVPVKVYPKRQRRLFVLDVTFPGPGTYEMAYYFTTDVGFFPRDVRLDDTNEPVRNLGKLVLKVS
jgi:hypothetical protein